jgi:hypothetical protein
MATFSIKPSEPNYISGDGTVFGHVARVKTKQKVKEYQQYLLRKNSKLKIKVFTKRKRAARGTKKVYDIYADYYKYITNLQVCPKCKKVPMEQDGLYTQTCPECGYFYTIHPMGEPLIKERGFAK